jgi:serine/threonine protein kinase
MHSLEYTAPESLRSPNTGFLRQVDSRADMWSLGMMLHKMLFFRLPYVNATDSAETEGRLERLESEVAVYPGLVIRTLRNETLQPNPSGFRQRSDLRMSSRRGDCRMRISSC